MFGFVRVCFRGADFPLIPVFKRELLVAASMRFLALLGDAFLECGRLLEPSTLRVWRDGAQTSACWLAFVAPFAPFIVLLFDK